MFVTSTFCELSNSIIRQDVCSFINIWFNANKTSFGFSSGGMKAQDSWVWVSDDSEITEFNWSPTQPDEDWPGAVLGMSCSDAFAWHDYSSAYDHPSTYVCQLDQCPEGFTLFEGSCYFVSDDSFSGRRLWPEAISYCREIGGKLLELDEPGDIERMKRFLDEINFGGSYNLWTGGWMSDEG